MFYMVDSFLRRNQDRFYHNGHLDYGIGADVASKGETPFPKIRLAIGQSSVSLAISNKKSFNSRCISRD